MEERNQMAVFIDFDNIEIGVKMTLNTTLDLALVLDALKERAEVVSKSAYGDWARAGNHSRTLTDHAVHMVQRNVTPRGDKNGADINLVVDALEMCFTRPHINSFAIVGGDSDFIALVEKLKQYGKRVFVVGGRAFTSGIMARNCHEFISYENLLSGSRGRGGGHGRGGGGGGGGGSSSSRISLEKGFAMVQRALKILADRGVQPQLGPIKSTLLQLDSTFSERDFGVSSFREFIQRLADKKFLSMKRIDQGYLVELDGDGHIESSEGAEESAESKTDERPSRRRGSRGGSRGGARREASSEDSGSEDSSSDKAASPTSESPGEDSASAEAASTGPLVPADGLALLGKAAGNLSEKRAGKPVYVRHLAQELRAIGGEFDETRYGFRTLTEMAQQAQKAGFLVMQRDRVGAWRVGLPEGGAPPVEGKSAAESADAGASTEAVEASSAEPAEEGGESSGLASKKTAAKKKSTTAKRAPAKKAAAKKTTAKKVVAKKTTAKKTTAQKTTAKKTTAKKTTAKKTVAKASDVSEG
ncbi:MAG: NYN domain-containing protein [Deltaproteobacteria bacterium]